MTQEQNKEPKNGKKKKLIIIIAAATLLLLVAGAVIFLFLSKDNVSSEKQVNPVTNIPVPTLHDPTTIGPMLNIDEFIVNIISADTPHYVKASLTLELSNKEVEAEAQLRMPQIRDAILLLIGNKTYEEIQDLQGKKQLKAELQNKLNAFLTTGSIKAIYFTNFVVQ